MAMQGFRNRRTARFFEGVFVRDYQGIERQARYRLALLDEATSLTQLTDYAGTRLERLRGDRAGQYSIRINCQWRVCFRWSGAGPYDVEIVDYH